MFIDVEGVTFNTDNIIRYARSFRVGNQLDVFLVGDSCATTILFDTHTARECALIELKKVLRCVPIGEHVMAQTDD